MSNPLEENTSVITLNSWADFHMMFVNLASSGSFSYNKSISDWANIGNTLNQGCGCTRKQREATLEAGYKSMVIWLTEDNKKEVKSFYKAEKIILKSDNLEFLSF